ncbi:MAG: hypothetical protein L0Y64_22265 [Myxococcaceae bacterium]|nr:hypothetical protein [Myxococcaceae bacterium]
MATPRRRASTSPGLLLRLLEAHEERDREFHREVRDAIADVSKALHALHVQVEKLATAHAVARRAAIKWSAILAPMATGAILGVVKLLGG